MFLRVENKFSHFSVDAPNFKAFLKEDSFIKAGFPSDVCGNLGRHAVKYNLQTQSSVPNAWPVGERVQ